MKLSRGVLCLALFLLPETAQAEQWEATFDRARATQILRELHRLNQLQVEAASIARRKVMSDELSELANHLRAEHLKLDRRVLAWARHHRLRVVAELTDDQLERLEAFRAVAPVELDRLYMAMVIVEYQTWIPVLTKHSQEIRHQALSRFLESIAKSLEEQQRRMQDLEAKLRVEG